MVTLVSQVSVAIGSPNTGTAPTTHSLVRLGWQVITGGVVSRKTTSWEQLARLVQSSVAVHVRRKIRTAGQIAGNWSSTKVMVRLVSQESVAVGSPKTGTAPVTHSLVRSGWQVITGGVVSRKTTNWAQL